MGEAKRRKAVDQTYGSAKRGLIVSPPMRIEGNQLTLQSGGLDRQELRSNLLFWDVLDFPHNNLIGIDFGPEAEFLQKEGILERTFVEFRGKHTGVMFMRDTQVIAYQRRDRRFPGQWSLATGERSISFPDENLIPSRGALVRLYNAIPVPDKDVPLSDILEFRQKRRSELLALRWHLEDVYQRVVNAGDGALAWNTELERLQQAIADHISASKESGLRLRLADISASLNLVPAAAASLAAFSAGLSIVPTLAAGLAAGIGLEIGAALKRGRVEATPFQYVTSYHKELF